MTKNIISFHALCRQRYHYLFDNDNGSIFIYKNGVVISKAYPCNGVYESVLYVKNDGTNVYNLDFSNG